MKILKRLPFSYPQPGEWTVKNPAKWSRLTATRPGIPPIMTLHKTGGNPQGAVSDQASGFVPPSSQKLSILPRRDEVDWDEEMVLAVSLGAKPTGGNSVRITGVTRNRKDREIVCSYFIGHPRPGDYVTQAFTFPGSAVVVPRNDRLKVRFIKMME